MTSLAVWKSVFQINPIYLTGGIAQNAPSQMMSFLAIVNPNIYGALLSGQAQGSTDPTSYDMDQAFGHFNVLPGGSLINESVPKYPLADMTMAANAIVRDPINVSLIWDAPMRGTNAWGTKLATMQALKLTLDTHNNLGGTYIILTPAFYYDYCILTNLVDNSRGNNTLPQNAWRFDFERPMIMTEAEAAISQNMLMRRLTGGLPTTGALSGPQAGGIGGEPVYIPGIGTLTTATPGAVASLPAPMQTVYQPSNLTLPYNQAYSP